LTTEFIDAWKPPSSYFLWLKSAEHPKFSNQMQERIKRDPAKKHMNKHEQTDNQLNVVRECLGN